MTELKQAVFLSYASEDAAAAQRICDTLRAAGVEVWFDQNELRGGDAWDHHIRRQIRDCALFVPIISAHTQARAEGYFRLEWRLAEERTHLMGRGRAFIVPVCVDGTAERDADVPDAFEAVQWTRLPGGDAPASFTARINSLLTVEEASGHAPVHSQPSLLRAQKPPSRRWIIAIAAVLAVALIAGQAWRLRTPRAVPSVAVAAATFNPPPHSIAVLPFVNMSGDKEQDYFSEGLTEELLNSLTRMNELRVAARTSSFSFQGEHPDIATVAHKLNVGAVLEGSVRRSAHTMRITTQLVSGVTGFHLWSQTYDRDIGDFLKLQTEIANSVANALQVTLLGDVTAKIELGGTRNPAAFDAYLRATQAYNAYETEPELVAAIADYSQTIRLDPNYALAYAGRANAFEDYVESWAKGRPYRDNINKGLTDARKAIALAPDLADGHAALAGLLADSIDFAGASREYERALELAPGKADVLVGYGLFAVRMGRTEAGLAAARRGVQLDPLNETSQHLLGRALIIARRYGEAIGILTEAHALWPNDGFITARLGYAYYLKGDLQQARALCEASTYEFMNRFCLAQVYEKLGRHSDADLKFAQLRNSWGDDAAVHYAMIYTEWGDTSRALDSLETAMKHPTDALMYVKTEFDSLRKEPRFQAIERALKFPD